MTKSNLMKKGFVGNNPSLMQVREGNDERVWGQELMQRLWRDVGYWPAPYGLIILLSYTPQDMPRGVNTHSGLGPSILITK